MKKIDLGQAIQTAANPQLAAVLSRALAGDELSPAESMQLSQLLSSRLFAWQNSYIQYSQGAISEDVMRGLDLTMDEWIRDMPAFRRFWENRMQRFAPDFVGHVNSIISCGSDD